MTNVNIFPSTILNDPGKLHPVLYSAYADSVTGRVPLDAVDEINEVLSLVPQTEAELTARYCAVATASGSTAVLGMMTLKQPDEVIRSFAQSNNPIELTDAYALHQRSGVGSALLAHVEEIARQRGHTEIVLVSGPRFRSIGWRFWTKLYGESVGIAERYFENTYDGNVWRKSLTDEK